MTVVRLTVLDSSSPSVESDGTDLDQIGFQLEGGPGFRSLFEQIDGQQAEAILAARSGGLARLDDQRQSHDRQLVTLDDPQLQAVGQPAALDRRAERTRPARPTLGLDRAVEGRRRAAGRANDRLIRVMGIRLGFPVAARRGAGIDVDTRSDPVQGTLAPPAGHRRGVTAKTLSSTDRYASGSPCVAA